MSNAVVFLIIVAGIGLGSLVAGRIAKGDLPARFGWTAAGAVPGAALLVGEPRYMLVLALVLPILVWRWQSAGRRT